MMNNAEFFALSGFDAHRNRLPALEERADLACCKATR
jgi:hypothetical protein